MAKVLVVDDGEVGRLGRAAALEVAGHRPTAMGWEEAGRLAGAPGSTDVDLVLAGLRPDPTAWDRYHTIGTLARLRWSLDRSPEVIAIVWGSAINNPLLGLRLARAGVGRMVSASEVACARSLDALVRNPTAGRSPTPSGHELACVGVGPDSDPEAALEWVLERASHPERGSGYLKAFDPAYAQNTCGLSRRQAHHLRAWLSRTADILPSVSRNGGGPVRDTSMPRWSEVVTVVNLCRGLDDVDAVEAPIVGGVEPRRFVA